LFRALARTLTTSRMLFWYRGRLSGAVGTPGMGGTKSLKRRLNTSSGSVCLGRKVLGPDQERLVL
jgi:hypothetical protein